MFVKVKGSRMKFTPYYEGGPVLIEAEKHGDERGFFARTFCEDEFAAAGLPVSWPQANVSFNEKAGTVRGMHFQVPPDVEPKIVRCTAGAMCDAVIDLRSSSPEFCKVIQVELSADNHKALYVPAGFAHGFQTLVEGTEVLYLMGSVYAPEAQRGVRWDDSAFDLSWPLDVSVISERDSEYPAFSKDEVLFP